MKLFGIFFLFAGIIIFIFPDILAYLLACLFVFLGLSLFFTSFSPRGTQSFRVGNVEVFRNKKP